MLLSLFYRIARPPGVPLTTLHDEMFDKHGALPAGTAERLTKTIRHIRTVGNFPGFFKAMGLKDIPSKENLCTFLKKTIEKSVTLGYSRWALTQGQALAIRRVREPGVEVAERWGVSMKDEEVLTRREISFFPGEKKGGEGCMEGKFRASLLQSCLWRLLLKQALLSSQLDGSTGLYPNKSSIKGFLRGFGVETEKFPNA